MFGRIFRKYASLTEVYFNVKGWHFIKYSLEQVEKRDISVHAILIRNIPKFNLNFSFAMIISVNLYTYF
jgi:hypothetical protein